MKSKLIIVEGLPGSGKSTAAKMIYDILKDKEVDSELYIEGNYNHPADFDGMSYFDDEDFIKLKKAYPESADLLSSIAVKSHNGYIIPYKKVNKELVVSFEHKVFNEITKNDVYELPLEIHSQLVVDRWSEFVNNYVNQEKVVIFECCLIQNPVTVTMIKNNSSKETTMNYVNSLAKKIMPLNPVLIYVEQDDIRKSFGKAVYERSKDWIDGFINYYTNQGYGLYNKLKGLDGVIEILKERIIIEKEIYDSLNLTKCRVDNSQFNNDLLKEKLENIIETCI